MVSPGTRDGTPDEWGQIFGDEVVATAFLYRLRHYREPIARPLRPAQRHYYARVTMGLIRYSVGNEHDPGDPWGRSELVILPDGAARLDHHFSRSRAVGAWSGRVDAAALDRLWSALDRAGFPAGSTRPLTACSAVRRLTVEADGQTHQTIIGWHEAASLPAYDEAFGILDAVINQLSADAVDYPTRESTIVRDTTAL